MSNTTAVTPITPDTAMRASTPSLYLRVEHGFDQVFGRAANPLKHLGALAFMMLWLLVATGIVLYAVLDTSAGGAYQSIDGLSRPARGAGSVLRSLHRYAADAFVLLTLAHLAREWMLGRFAQFRRYSWLTGVPLLPLMYAAAIGGFWLNWDRLGQYSAMATAQWLDAAPLLASPLARNFLSGAVSDRLFSLLVFVHLGVPLLLLFGLWFHLQRISRPAVWPPRALVAGCALMLLALALASPIRSHGMADLATVPQALRLDWIVLFMHPLADATSDGMLWLMLLAVIGALLALPFTRGFAHSFTRKAAPTPVAVVDAANCNGCKRCVDDCPYGAITMVPHPSGKQRLQLAQVASHLCASCGICVGACPSSTPFRSTQRLVTGIDMPQWPIDELRNRLQQGLAAMHGARRYVVFGCDHGARVDALASPEVLGFSLACTGMLAPSFVEYALRGGADGVLIAGCREGGCEFRLGQRWTAQRLQGEREPHLRQYLRQGPDRQWATVWADAGDEAALRQALRQLRQLRELPQWPQPRGQEATA